MRLERRENRPLWLLIGGPIAVFSLWAMFDNTRLYFVTLLNGLTLASLYFIVASGFTLVFGLMRNVNLAHGSLYMIGAFACAVVTGIAFGFMPARKAARLDPVAALTSV